MTDYCLGKIPSPVVRNTLGSQPGQRLPFRSRTAAPSPKARTRLSSSFHNLTFDANFYASANRWASNMNYLFQASPRKRSISYWGDVGTKACHRYTWAHNRARALDLSAIGFSDGYVMDCNYSHQADLAAMRMYLATWANLRRFFATVLTADYNAAHRDHIHFDNRTPMRALSRNQTSDVVLMQRSANLLVDRRLAVDGDWGPATNAAYTELVGRLNMACRDPQKVLRDSRDFLYFVIRHCTANIPAGTYRSVEC